jgi:hypothetical protein
VEDLWFLLCQPFISKYSVYVYLLLTTKLKKKDGQLHFNSIVFSVKDGRFSVYDGSRFLEEFVNFVKEQKWRDIEPIPSWKSPGSFV